LALAAAFAFGLAAARALGWLLPSSAASPPYAAIVASIVIDLVGLAALLIWLPAAAGRGKVSAGTAAWLGGALVCAAALAGLGLAGAQGESWRTFLVLWGLMAAQCAVLAALYGWLKVLCRFELRWAGQITWLLLSLAVTALFWSREPLERLGRGAEDGSATAAWLAAGIVAASPPLAVASVWHQESTAARHGGASFDIVRAPLTYQVWIGSYRAVPYPQILPAMRKDSPHWGLVLGMLLPGLLLLALNDVAVFFMRRTPSSGRR
jgi:hypothetical protein